MEQGAVGTNCGALLLCRHSRPVWAPTRPTCHRAALRSAAARRHFPAELPTRSAAAGGAVCGRSSAFQRDGTERDRVPPGGRSRGGGKGHVAALGPGRHRGDVGGRGERTRPAAPRRLADGQRRVGPESARGERAAGISEPKRGP